jgi:TonB family protein
VTLNAGDFPYAWYIRKVHEKIRQRWEGRAMPGRQPAVIFEIARDGQLRGVTIDKSSGNAYYDRLAMAAVSDAGPFEPLPPEFPKGILTVGLQFGFDPVARQ